jgi:hypothetical protein
MADVTIIVDVPSGALGDVLTAEDIALAAQEYVDETIAASRWRRVEPE